MFFLLLLFSSVVNVSNVRFVVFETRFRWKNRPSPPPPKAFQPTRLRSDLKSNSLNIPDPLCPSILCSWGLVKRLKWSWPLQISSGIFFSFFIQLSSHPASFFLKNAYSYPIFLKMIFQKKKKKICADYYTYKLLNTEELFNFVFWKIMLVHIVQRKKIYPSHLASLKLIF